MPLGTWPYFLNDCIVSNVRGSILLLPLFVLAVTCQFAL